MKIAEAGLFTRVIAVIFAGILAFMSIRGLFGAPAMMAHIREKAQLEDRPWIGSIVIGSAFMMFFCTVSVWMIVFAVKTFRVPKGSLRFIETKFIDKFIGISATILFFLASMVVGISWVTEVTNREISHGLLTSFLLPSVFFGTIWLATIVWKMFRSSSNQEGEDSKASPNVSRTF